MIQIQKFTFNDFQENTYLLFDETKECVIIDPGCYKPAEQNELSGYIKANGLKPVKLLNTHCHIDHVLGNSYTAKLYNIALHMHKGELPTYTGSIGWGVSFGLMLDAIPESRVYVDETDVIAFGNSKLEILFTPGHSPASISFINKEQNFVIAGDVLFYQSIGRTDLPGGNFETLIASIKNKLLTLPDDCAVYSGHGPATTIKHEKQANPFLR